MQVHRFYRIALCAAVCLAPALLLDWTAAAGEDGVARFRNGLYGRDQKILKAFRSRFRFHASVPAPEQGAVAMRGKRQGGTRNA